MVDRIKTNLDMLLMEIKLLQCLKKTLHRHVQPSSLWRNFDSKGLKEYTDGVAQVDDGAAQLNDGVGTFDSKGS